MVFSRENRLYAGIAADLLAPGFLTPIGARGGKIRAYVEKREFREKVKEMVERQDYSSLAVLELCRGLLDELAGGAVPEDWLYTIYQFALGRSFPAAVEIEVPEGLTLPCLVYLQVLRAVSEQQKQSHECTWQSIFPLQFLSAQEQQELEEPREYKRLQEAFAEEYIYEMMKLNQEVIGYNTLDHICGVHYLALFLARQLKGAGVPVDLARVSGAAMGHDIGKYGCKRSELDRVAYLHYYYTDCWFKRHNINYIRNIAINHSVWDLELENLSLESLLLIYSDFRVKKRQYARGVEKMYIYSLQDAFTVILKKLDNMNREKERRYQRVYNKLRDFEDYLLQLGINVDLTRYVRAEQDRRERYYALKRDQEVIAGIKNLAIHHNIELMHKLRNESSLNAILESARSEADRNNLREYINVLEEYSTYLTQKQKLMTVKFLYEQLTHAEDDIRRECAELMGILIAAFDEDYRKAVPEDVQLDAPEISSCQLLQEYVEKLLYPAQETLPIHRKWIGSSMSHMLGALFRRCRADQADQYMGVLLPYFDLKDYSKDRRLFLLEAIQYLPLPNFSRDAEAVLLAYLQEMLGDGDDEIRLLALDSLYSLGRRSGPGSRFQGRCRELFTPGVMNSPAPVENFLGYKLAQVLKCSGEVTAGYQKRHAENMSRVSPAFLSNLKTSTNWVVKKIQVDFLLEYALQDLERNGLYTAIHFCNLLKVSESASVRNRAGAALLDIVPRLPREQKNDVVVELLRALEIEGYQFAKYIPAYLGKLILGLQPVELDEVLEDLEKKVKQAGSHIVLLLLRTIGVALENSLHQQGLPARRAEYRPRMVRMLGILLNGLVHDNQQVKQVAVSVLGSKVFGTTRLNLEEKRELFCLIAKKILTLIGEEKKPKELTFFANAAGLNHIYRFTADYAFYRGEMGYKTPERIAFFAGTFDPFSLSHREIAKAIRDLGFEVYLAVDEFSWSKMVQPNLVRRKIIKMSIAGELNIFLYPEDLPVNIANPRDLQSVKGHFGSSDVYIVVGSDVIANASAYRMEKNEHSIYSFPHIVFERRSDPKVQHDGEQVAAVLKRIRGTVITLSLPPQYEDISSSQIRTYIDEKRDISQLMDPLAQKYIYAHNLYRRQPQYKTLLQPKALQVEVMEAPTDDFLQKVARLPFFAYEGSLGALRRFARKLTPRIMLLKSSGGEILGFSAFHWLRSSMFYSEFPHPAVSEYIRNNAVGRVIVLDGFFVDREAGFEGIEQMLLTETLTYCLAKDYTYGVYKNMLEEYSPSSLEELLRNHGFAEIPQDDVYRQPVLAVNMTYPCTLYLNVETVLKEPFLSNIRVQRTINRCRKRLQEAMTRLYPGHLVVSFNRTTVFENLIKRICAENGVPPVPTSPRILGPYMCVPFGAILKGHIIPNTVTKSIHADRFFNPDMRTHRIKAYPVYLDLRTQVKMLRSFDRPIILVDDILHKGYRLKGLDPLFKKEKVQIKKVMVPILSGRGKELMDMQNRQVDGAYFIPKLRVWFNESLLYPFIGGDTLWRGKEPQGGLVPSVNQILPYTTPGFIRGATREAIYDLSEVCIINALEVMLTLEEEYQRLQERSLTLAHLGEVFISPRYPDHGQDMQYDLNLNPSHYLKNDLEHLQRLQGIICDPKSSFRT